MRASANHWSTDQHPEATERAVLDILARTHALTARALSYLIFDSTKVGAGSTSAAIGRLHNRRLVERAPGNRWRVTDAGRRALDLDDVMGETA